MTWKELKEFCNSLDEKQLKQKVILWREDEAISKIDPITLEEDQYVEKDLIGEGCIPISEVEYILKHQPEDYPDGINHWNKVYVENTPILMEDF